MSASKLVGAMFQHLFYDSCDQSSTDPKAFCHFSHQLNQILINLAADFLNVLLGNCCRFPPLSWSVLGTVSLLVSINGIVHCSQRHFQQLGDFLCLVTIFVQTYCRDTVCSKFLLLINNII